jgi:hypothetical protein
MPPTRRSEIGAIGLPLFSGFLSLDPNKRLRGAEAAKIYRSMAYDEPACTAVLTAASNLLRTDLAVEPGGSTDNDKRAGEHLETCLDDFRQAKETYLRQMYGMLWAGWDIHEIVYKRRGGIGSKYSDGAVGWAHWGLRRQETLYKWGTDAKTGEVKEFVQRPAPDYTLRSIPISKCVHLVSDDSEGSPEGKSVERGMYRLWQIVRNLEVLMGIALERFGTGFPIVEVDATLQGRLSDDDITLIQDFLKNIRQNEEAGGLLPAGVSFKFVPSPGLSTEDYLNVIKYLRIVMLSTMLADFISLGTDSGSYALGKDKTELFLLSLNGYQDRLLSALNQQAVARLFRFNDFGKLTDLPRLTLPAVKRYDLQALGAFAKFLHVIGAFHPTPDDEAFFRKVSDLPDLDMATIEELFQSKPVLEPDEEETDEGQDVDMEGTDSGDDEDMIEEETEEGEEELVEV